MGKKVAAFDRYRKSIPPWQLQQKPTAQYQGTLFLKNQETILADFERGF
jgi:hypothetical protein